MEGKEAIIAGIIEKAEREAAGLIADAESERAELLEKTRAEAERRKQDAIAAAHANAEAIASRGKTLDELESRKTELAAKQQVIDEAFEEAVRKLLNMTDHIYREFIGNLVAEYASDGDRVIVAERDVKRLHADWLKSLCDKTGKRLTLADETHKGRGGVILAGKLCDTNLTLDAMLSSLRESSLPALATKLFGGKGA